MKDDAAPDQAPTVPAIPLRARQRHRARSKKPASSRWRGRQETVHEEVPVASATFSTGTPPPVASWEDAASRFFDAGDSISPVAHEEPEDAVLPALSRTPRRGLAAIVIGAVALAGVLCVAAGMKASTSAAAKAPAAAAAAPPPVTVVPAPVDVPPVESAAPSAEVPELSPKLLREKARAELSRRKIADAVATAGEATKAEPEDAEGWLLLGAAQLEAGRAADARETFRTCVQLAKRGPVGECRAFAR